MTIHCFIFRGVTLIKNNRTAGAFASSDTCFWTPFLGEYNEGHHVIGNIFLKTSDIDSTDKSPLANHAGIRLNLYKLVFNVQRYCFRFHIRCIHKDISWYQHRSLSAVQVSWRKHHFHSIFPSSTGVLIYDGSAQKRKFIFPTATVVTAVTHSLIASSISVCLSALKHLRCKILPYFNRHWGSILVVRLQCLFLLDSI